MHVRTIAAGVVGGSALLAAGMHGIAGIASASAATSPATSSDCVPVAPVTPTQTPTAPSSSSTQSTQPPATTSTSPPASSPPPPAGLCISVTQPVTSIERGQAGTFTVQVWSENWTAGGSVTVELSAQPAGITPAFTTQDGSICTPQATADECTMPVPVKQNQVLQVQVPVASSATSVSQVTLKAVALPGAVTLAGPLSATETAQVTAAPSKQTSKSPTPKQPSKAAKTPAQGHVGTDLLNQNGSIGAGALPELNGAGSSMIGPGDASGIFPKISPSAAPSPAPGNAAGKAKADPAAKISLLPLGMPVVTAQIIGLVALAVAFLLALTRLSLRRSRPRRKADAPGTTRS